MAEIIDFQKKKFESETTMSLEGKVSTKEDWRNLSKEFQKSIYCDESFEKSWIKFIKIMKEIQ